MVKKTNRDLISLDIKLKLALSAILGLNHSTSTCHTNSIWKKSYF